MLPPKLVAPLKVTKSLVLAPCAVTVSTLMVELKGRVVTAVNGLVSVAVTLIGVMS